jgi:uncharacterized membrane protein YraQ (UPF0718 family)
MILPGLLNAFAVVFVSIVLQSLPFVLLGVFASAVVQRHLSPATVARWLPRRRAGVVMAASLFGLVAPVCDCGVIPLARRLADKGVPGYAATTFIIAAPVVNPIVLVSTAVAFQPRWEIVGLRMAMTLSVALAVGFLAARLLPGADGPRALALSIHGGSGEGPGTAGGTSRSSGMGLIAQATSEFFDVIFFIVLGALFTAATQTLVPRGDLAALGGTAAGSVAVLMPVATVLSICSEADAFVARAFAGAFTPGAVLAFMTIGQIVDLRNGALLVRTLDARLTGLILAVSYGLVFVEGVLLNGVLR